MGGAAANPFGAEHAWWAERRGVSGVPIDRARVRLRREAAAAAAEAERRRLRREYWSAERLLADSRPAGYAEQAPRGPRRGAAGDLGADPWRDPYSVLGLVPGATLADARAARRAMAKQLHPDRSGDPRTAEQMSTVNVAFEVIERILAS
jgi:hypothetical protein